MSCTTHFTGCACYEKEWKERADELAASLSRKLDIAEATAEEWRNTAKLHLEQLAAMTKERDEWKWEYENVSKFASDFQDRLTIAQTRIAELQKDLHHSTVDSARGIDGLLTRLDAAQARIKELEWFSDQINQHVIPGERDTKDAALHLVQSQCRRIAELEAEWRD